MTVIWDMAWLALIGSFLFHFHFEFIEAKPDKNSRWIKFFCFVFGFFIMILFLFSFFILYFGVSRPWMLNYLINPDSIGIFESILFIFYPLSFLSGWFITGYLMKGNKRKSILFYNFLAFFWPILTIILGKTEFFIASSTENYNEAIGDYWWNFGSNMDSRDSIINLDLSLFFILITIVALLSMIIFPTYGIWIYINKRSNSTQ